MVALWFQSIVIIGFSVAVAVITSYNHWIYNMSLNSLGSNCRTWKIFHVACLCPLDDILPPLHSIIPCSESSHPTRANSSKRCAAAAKSTTLPIWRNWRHTPLQCNSIKFNALFLPCDFLSSLQDVFAWWRERERLMRRCNLLKTSDNIAIIQYHFYLSGVPRRPRGGRFGSPLNPPLFTVLRQTVILFIVDI